MIRNILVVGIIVLLAACQRDVPIYNIESEPIITGTGQTLNLTQIQTAIRRGVLDKTWVVEEDGENKIKATLTKGRKIAVVTVTYSLDQYSIHYKTSTLLFYDGTNIHRRYNAWVKGLRKSINKQFTNL